MENNTKLPVDILWVADTIQKDNYQVKAHTHDYYYHLIYIKQGRCHMAINDQSYELTGNTIAIASPDDLHFVSSIPSQKTIHLVEIKFVVNSSTLNKALKQIPKVFQATVLSESLLDLIIKNGYTDHGYANLNASRSYLSSFLYAICDKPMKAADLNPHSFCLRGIDISCFSPATTAAVQFVEENYMNEIPLEKIGSSIGYHKNYVCTMVKNDLNINVNELITFVRVHKAANLLYYSDYSIKQICELTGFKNISHFTRIFRKMVGIPPAQYRKSYPDAAYDETGFDATCSKVIPLWLNGLLRDYIESK